MKSKTKGYISGVVAAACYGLNPLFALPLYDAGMTTDSVLCCRYFLATAIVALMLLSRGGTFRMARRVWFPVIAVGVIAAMSSEALFMSYHYMDASIASTILFVYPLMVAVIMALRYHERLSAVTYLCLVVALVGVALLYVNEEGATLSLLGLALVLSSSLTYAVYIIVLNRPPLNGISTLTAMFYILLTGAICFAARLGWEGGISLPDSPVLWVNVVALAVFPTAISLTCTAISAQHIGATPTAILGVLEPLTAIFFGVVVFHETLTPLNIVGLILILSSVTWVIAQKSP